MSLVFHDDSWSSINLAQFVEEKNYPAEWAEFFEREDVKKDIAKKIISVKLVYPPVNRVFRTFSLPIQKIRVVILGMDPYHNPGSATGLCFSIPRGTKLNPSLRNIYEEIGCTQRSGNLEHWFKQGCFMLNTALTVEEGRPGSHTDIWYDFTRKVIEEISANTHGVAWLLMGAKAIAFKQYIDTSKHGIFQTSHPSPFSAHKSSKDAGAFMKSGVFNNINLFLQKQSLPIIKWTENG